MKCVSVHIRQYLEGELRYDAVKESEVVDERELRVRVHYEYPFEQGYLVEVQ